MQLSMQFLFLLFAIRHELSTMENVKMSWIQGPALEDRYDKDIESVSSEVYSQKIDLKASRPSPKCR